MGRRRIRSGRERFDEKWMLIPETGCWIWLAAKAQTSAKQYGHFNLDGRALRAHRAAWLIYRGEIPEGMQVLHSCDIGICVNPDHLRLGTHTENMQEMVERGRHNNGSHERKGYGHWNAVFTEQDHAEMVRMRNEGKLIREIAEHFDCSKSNVSKVCRRLKDE